jgi:threonine aldolase
MIDLRSDTVTVPTVAMREFMLSASVGDDVFGEDPTINQLQDMIAEMTGMQKALFVPSGTQANQISINAYTRPGHEVICDYNSHIFNYESGAAGMLSGVQLHPIVGENGHPTLDQIKEAVRPEDDHYPQTGLICLENTHNRAGGTIYPISEIRKISDFAKNINLPLHLDGARLWNASISTGISIKDYCSYFDSVSMCFSKGLGAPIGSIVAGTKDFIKKAHYYRKAYGGGMRQAGILAAACIFAVENHFERLKTDHENARKLAKILSGYPEVQIDMNSVQSNIVIADFKNTGRTATELKNLLFSSGIATIVIGPTKIRFVTHMHVSSEDIESTTSIFDEVIKKEK